MKTKLFTTVWVLLALGACRQEPETNIRQMQETDKTAQWDIRINYPAFSSSEAETEKSYARLNDEIKGLVNGIQAAFREQVQENIHALDSIGEKQVAPYELIIEDSVFMADPRYISVRMLAYEMLGGANGQTNYYAVNYDVRTQKFLNKQDILNMSKAAAINALLKESLRDPDQCFTFDAPTVENVTAVNLTSQAVEFTYNKYILGPGSCGTATISIPREKLQDMLLLKNDK